MTLDIGCYDKPLQRFFIGYVERSTSVNSVEQVLFCRDLAAILSQPLPLNLRHVDLRAVLTAISNKTGLTEQALYPDHPAPRPEPAQGAQRGSSLAAQRNRPAARGRRR